MIPRPGIERPPREFSGAATFYLPVSGAIRMRTSPRYNSSARQWDTHLLHGVPVANRDAIVRRGVLVAHGLEVHSDAQRRADLVFPAVALADGTGVVKVHHEVLAQLPIDLLGLGAELLGQGQNGRLVGRQRRMQAQHGAHVGVALLVGANHFLVVSFAQER